jgi:hypothetical protein
MLYSSPSEPTEAQVAAFLRAHGLNETLQSFNHELSQRSESTPTHLSTPEDSAATTLPDDSVREGGQADAANVAPGAASSYSNSDYSSTATVDDAAGTDCADASGGSVNASASYTTVPAPPADFAGFVGDQDDSVVFFQEESSTSADDGAPRLRDFSLRVVYDPLCNGLEEAVNFPIAVDTFIAERYQICDYLGSGVFSRAVQCHDIATGRMVCIKVIRNNKDFLDQVHSHAARDRLDRGRAPCTAHGGARCPTFLACSPFVCHRPAAGLLRACPQPAPCTYAACTHAASAPTHTHRHTHR